jgi:hypothetical protein
VTATLLSLGITRYFHLRNFTSQLRHFVANPAAISFDLRLTRTTTADTCTAGGATAYLT